MSRRLGRRTVVVTGGAAGIGRATVLAFALDGASVVIADQNEAAAAVVARHAAAVGAESGGGAESIIVDLADVASVRSMVNAVSERFGAVDVLVNNAGITIPGDVASTTESSWDAINAVNLRGMFFVMQGFSSGMRKRGSGAIVNVASISGKGYRSTIAYAASKGGVVAMTRVAAQELGPFGVTVNSVAPGFTDETAVMQEAVAAMASLRCVGTDVVTSEIVSSTALRRLVRPEEIAATVLFLASPGAAAITGQSINVDCGLVYD